MAQPTSRSGQTIESLKEKMARDPLSRAFLQLAEEYRRAGRFEEAVQVCQEGLARHPTYHTARIALGRTYLEAGDLEAARRTLGEVIELAPENHLAAKLLAEVQRRLGDAAGAAETYRSILRHYPGDREVEALLRDLLDAAGPSEAGPGGEPPLDYRPEDLGAPPPAPVVRPTPPVAAAPPPQVAMPPQPPARPEEPQESGAGDALQTNTLAELYLRQGLVDRAREVYRAMLQVDPSNERARRRLGELADPAVGQTSAAPPPIPPPIPTAAPASPGRTAPVGVTAPSSAPGPSAGVAPEPPDAPAVERAAVEEPTLRPVAPPTPVPPAAATPAPAGTDPRHASARRLRRWLQTVQRGSAPPREAGPS